MTIKTDSIPISVSLNPTLQSADMHPQETKDKKRVVLIAVYAILVAACISCIAKVLIFLINAVTNLSFFGLFTIHEHHPSENQLGLWVILVPTIGGFIVGLMALYGSKAIRGHGIPEAMEQILTNQSKINPAITYLKPLSSAIAIGTGGPFGAEGPIIATGGALGSTLGQLLKITHNERKILLASGAVAGMTAIFGTPIAAIFLAIELLLFEFSPRAIIAVSLACITGAAGHHILFGTEPVFYISNTISTPSNAAIFSYSIIGVIIGVLSIGITKAVYAVEDSFERLPIHWMWWPAIGGLAVGIIGYFAPRTLGVGYENITDLLSGNMPLKFVLTLCILKFLSWVIALGSGTSGGTLAPLLTIGAATGILLGTLTLYFFPNCGITPSLMAVVGMSAMFAGSSRALITSIIFALETTGQFNALLPLLGACVASYTTSFLFMRHTIMTEKIARRGVQTPHTYEPDLLAQILVKDALESSNAILEEQMTIAQARSWFGETIASVHVNYMIIVTQDNNYSGIISASNLYSHHHDLNASVASLIKRKPISLAEYDTLRLAIDKMISENVDVLPVVSQQQELMGVLSYQHILSAYYKSTKKANTEEINILLKSKFSRHQ
ncbi:chloride channel protein [Olivibacter ginsenosidimutans]|uniref:Chloride channel protein n=1 Tax=Olivibacter ginsenosidimutans TaxID=1176537 RepID=A0ABP9BDA5_9SPHI